MKKGYNMLILKALEFFIENSYEEIHLREFSRRIAISPNSSQRFLNFFLKNDFIVEERKANGKFSSISDFNDKNKLKMIFSEVLLDFFDKMFTREFIQQ
jgi:CTP-dependent riboflavin kinase